MPLCPRFFLSGLLVIGLSGCVAMSERDCVTTDWYGVGQRDAERTYPTSRLYDRMQSCQKYGVVINEQDKEAYLAGHQNVTQSYCTPEQGFQLGLNGTGYYGSCSSYSRETDRLFRVNYQNGKRIYEARRNYDSILSELEQYEMELRIGTRNTGSQRRRMNQDERADWREKIVRKKAELRRALYQVEVAENVQVIRK